MFRRSGASFDRRKLIEAANAIGPPMRLLHWRKLAALGQLPDFTSAETDDALSGIRRFGAPNVEIIMVSHRWLRPSISPGQSHPDDVDGTKAMALAEFSRWRRDWVARNHGFAPEIYYWIDYCCFDQSDLAGNMSMLPLWIACCERMVCFETDDYQNRAWCRVEQLLSYTFNFADHHTVIGRGFQASVAGDGRAEFYLITRPTEGNLTDPGDLEHVRMLEALASRFNPAAVNRQTDKALPLPTFGTTSVRRFRL